MLDDSALDQLFRRAQSIHSFTAQPVTDEVLRQLYELLKWGPTAWNSQPGRYVFVRSVEAKARLGPAMSSSNRAKTLAAPVTAIVAYDTHFFERTDEWWQTGRAREQLRQDAALAQTTAMRNGSLQGAYLIVAARALGLAAGPMSGFDADKVNQEFFAESTWRANFLVNLGYPAPGTVRPRAGRVPFEDAVRIL